MYTLQAAKLPSCQADGVPVNRVLNELRRHPDLFPEAAVRDILEPPSIAKCFQ